MSDSLRTRQNRCFSPLSSSFRFRRWQFDRQLFFVETPARAHPLRLQLARAKPMARCIRMHAQYVGNGLDRQRRRVPSSVPTFVFVASVLNHKNFPFCKAHSTRATEDIFSYLSSNFQYKPPIFLAGHRICRAALQVHFSSYLGALPQGPHERGGRTDGETRPKT